MRADVRLIDFDHTLIKSEAPELQHEDCGATLGVRNLIKVFDGLLFSLSKTHRYVYKILSRKPPKRVYCILFSFFGVTVCNQCVVPYVCLWLMVLFSFTELPSLMLREEFQAYLGMRPPHSGLLVQIHIHMRMHMHIHIHIHID